MAITAFGPQGPNYATARPTADPKASAGIDTWFKNCSAAGAKDGTFATADFFNVFVGNLRYLVRTAGIALDDADDTMVWQAVRALVGNVTLQTPTLMSGNLTLYVNDTLGNDANDGLSNAAGHALKTLQRAVDIAFGFVPGQYIVTVRVDDASYAAGFLVPARPGPQISFVGNTVTPANVQVTSSSGSTMTVGGPNVATINGFRVSSNTSNGIYHGIISNSGSQVTVKNIEFGAVGGGCIVSGNGQMYIDGPIKFSGNCSALLQSGYSGQILLLPTSSFIVSNNITVSYASAAAGTSAGIQVATTQPTWTLTGSVSGVRYVAAFNASIITNGGGANYFPGNSAGSVSYGGQFL
jgi:hypothetical protein